MLDYLVSSTTRRRLLTALWRDGARGTASSLARLAGTPVAATYRELGAMVDAGLADKQLESGHLVYRANEGCPHAEPLRQILSPAPQPSPSTVRGERSDDVVREQLVARGAPLWKRRKKVARATMPLPTLLARAFELSRRDPTVAKVLPYVLLLNRDALHLEELVPAFQEAQQKHTAAMFFALSASLSDEHELADWAELLRDRRRCKPQDFFEGATSPRLRALAERNTPDLVRDYHYRMNMPMEDFRAVLAKFPLDEQVPG